MYNNSSISGDLNSWEYCPTCGNKFTFYPKRKLYQIIDMELIKLPLSKVISPSERLMIAHDITKLAEDYFNDK